MHLNSDERKRQVWVSNDKLDHFHLAYSMVCLALGIHINIAKRHNLCLMVDKGSPSSHPPRVGLSRINFKCGNTGISSSIIAYRDGQTTAVHGCRQRTLLEVVDTDVRNHISERDAQKAEEAELLNVRRSTRKDSVNSWPKPGY